MNFYTKVVSKHAQSSDLKISVGLQVSSAQGISPQKIEETKAALRELGLDDDIKIDKTT